MQYFLEVNNMSGRNWTRRSIEELVDGYLKKHVTPGPGPDPSDDGNDTLPPKNNIRTFAFSLNVRGEGTYCKCWELVPGKYTGKLPDIQNPYLADRYDGSKYYPWGLYYPVQVEVNASVVRGYLVNVKCGVSTWNKMKQLVVGTQFYNSRGTNTGVFNTIWFVNNKVLYKFVTNASKVRLNYSQYGEYPYITNGCYIPGTIDVNDDLQRLSDKIYETCLSIGFGEYDSAHVNLTTMDYDDDTLHTMYDFDTIQTIIY